MKGTLHKTESGWVVKYYIMRESSHAIHPNEYTLPILDGDYYELNRPGQYNEGKEIEFEIVEFPVPPTNGPVSNSISIYAKLVDQKHTPMKGGEGWDKMLDKAIQDKAEDFTNGHYHYRGKDAFIHGYKQGQENIKGIKYSEEDMRELYAYAKNDNTNIEDYLQALNKQDSDWLTMKEGDITVNFKPMPEFDDPKYPTKLHQLQIQAAEACFRKYPNNEILYPTDELKDAYKAGVVDGLREWRLDSYDRPKYPEVKIICPKCKVLMPCECNPTRQTSLLNSIRSNPSWDTIIREFHIATQQVEIGTPPLIFEGWLVDNYNPPTKKQDNE
jgi:hypothetical protein